MIWLPKIAAIEIGNRAVRIAVVRTGLKRPRVLSLVERDIMPREDESKSDATVRALKDALEEINVSPDLCVSHISGRNAVVRIIRVPFTKVRRIESVIKFELEPHVPLPIDDLVVDFEPIRMIDGKTEVLAVGIKKTLLKEHLDTLAQAGIDPEIVDLDFAPLTALWLLRNRVSDTEITVLVHPANDRSLLVIMEGRKLIFLRGMDFSAEDIRRNGQQVAEAILTTLRAFSATSRRAEIQRLILTGPGFTAEDCAVLERRLGLSVSADELGADVIPLEKVAAGDVSSWTGVVGSAFNSRGRSRIGFNFRKEQFTQYSTIAELKKNVIFSTVIIALLLVAGFGYVQSQIHIKGAERDALDSRMGDLFEKAFPGTAVIPDKVLEQMERAVNDRKKDYDMYGAYLAGKASMLDLLNDVITHIPESGDILVEQLSIDRGIVTISGEVAGGAAVETIRRQLGTSKLLQDVGVTKQETNKDTGKIDFTISAKERL